jgi:hypothetical protein
LTLRSLRSISRADVEEAPIEFKRPEPVKIPTAGGGTATIAERAPYMPHPGVVVDPRRARTEAVTEAALTAHEARNLMPREPTKPGPYGEEATKHELDVYRGRKKIDREFGGSPNPTYDQAMRRLEARFQKKDEFGEAIRGEFTIAPSEMHRMAQEWASGKMPKTPERRPVTFTEGAPEEGFHWREGEVEPEVGMAPATPGELNGAIEMIRNNGRTDQQNRAALKAAGFSDTEVDRIIAGARSVR